MRTKEIENIYKRLEEKLGVGNVKEVGELIGVKDNAISSKKARGTLHYDEIINYCLEHGISLDYVMKGLNPRTSLVIRSKNDASEPRREDELLIPFFDTINSAGEQFCGYGLSGYIPIDKITFNLANPHTSAIRIFGDSMANTIKPDNIIFVDRRKREFIDGKIFLIKVSGEFHVKRLFRSLGTDNIILKSDNIAYPTFELKPSEFKILGMFIYSIQAKVSEL